MAYKRGMGYLTKILRITPIPRYRIVYTLKFYTVYTKP
jgi:hypothetical protein